MTDTTAGSALDRERADLIETLGRHRWFLRYTAQKLTDEQGATRSTASALTLSGLIHHVADTESRWAGFIERGRYGRANRIEHPPSQQRLRRLWLYLAKNRSSDGQVA